MKQFQCDVHLPAFLAGKMQKNEIPVKLNPLFI
jgi:hypothetical protein